MRPQRLRVFNITIHGLTSYQEQAGIRSVLEVQHQLSLDHPGKFVRVLEKYIGGARSKRVEAEAEEQ